MTRFEHYKPERNHAVHVFITPEEAVQLLAATSVPSKKDESGVVWEWRAVLTSVANDEREPVGD